MAKKKPSKTGRNESWELPPREVLIPLLLPGETLGIALSGATGWFEGLSLVDLFMALLDAFGGVATSQLNRTTYIGITDADFVFATTKDPKMPSSLQRAPLGSVSVVKFKESRTPFLIDVLVIDTGKKRLSLSTGQSLRPVIREFVKTLTMRKQEAGMIGSARHFQGTLAQQTPPLPLHARLSRPLTSALGEVSVALRADGPAQASLRTSRYSFYLLVASGVASFVLTFGLMALGIILPTGLPERFRDVLLFILLLPVFLSIFLSLFAALVAVGLSIYSIFKRGEKPLTIIASLLVAAALAIISAFGVLLLLSA